MRNIIAIIAVLALGGCALPGELGGTDFFAKAVEAAGEVDTAIAGNFAKGITLYCKLPRVARDKLRDHLNARTEMEGNKAVAWCVGDPAITLGQ